MKRIHQLLLKWHGMVAAIFFTTILLAIRMLVTGHSQFVFLEWNLILALVPLVISTYLIGKTEMSKPKLLLLSVIWLLFFPNAPYIITDLMHLARMNQKIPWFDSILIFTFAFTAMFAGLFSILHFKILFTRYGFKRYYAAFQLICFTLTGFGIYLGRFERWNSWDIVFHPRALLSSCLQSLVEPKALAITAMLAGCLSVAALLLKQGTLLLYDTDQKNVE